MNGRSGPLSPNSAPGSEWSGVSQYQNSNEPSYSPSHPHNRGNLITPPISGSSNGTQPRMSSGMNGRIGAPSPPSSVARSSYGTTLSTSDTQRRKTLQMEERLSQHYAILKRFLAQSLRDEKGNAKPNRARDKLLRLSPVQFQELSTDVYDELLRRQSFSGQPRNGTGQVPEYLLPKDNFHPKRNQARQKLATLPPLRFQDLATDVFYELERRFPVFAGRDISRIGSPAISQYGAPPSRVGTPNGFRQNHGPRNPSLGSQVMAGLGIPGVEGPNDNYGRPTAKTSQSNTIIPNKSIMVEDDDDDGSDIYGSRRDTTLTSRSAGGSEKDRKLAGYESQVGEFQHRVGELQGKVRELEEQLRDKDLELDKIYESHNERSGANDTERQKWSSLQSDLEAKLTQAQNLNSNLQIELDKARSHQNDKEREMQAQIDQLASDASGGGEWKVRFDVLNKESQELRAQLLRQEKVTGEVKEEAAGWLLEMKGISERSNQSFEREESLVHQVHTLENELQDWKSRYAKTRTKFRALRASSMTKPLQLPDMGSVTRDFIAQEGLVKDIHLSKFQLTIDELLHSARESEPSAVLSRVRSVIVSVRSIVLDMGDTRSSKSEVMQLRHKATTRLSATANNLITAARNFALSKGLSPVSILDAAASHVAAAAIELIRLVKVRPTPAEELEDDGDIGTITNTPADYYGVPYPRASAGGDSVYSTTDSAKPSQEPSNPTIPSKHVLDDMNKGAQIISGHTSTKGVPNSSNHRIQELKGFLEIRNDSLKASIQSLVSSVRINAEPPAVLDQLAAIISTASQIINKTSEDADVNDEQLNNILQTLSENVDLLEDADREGEEISNVEDWNAFAKRLPPLGFAIAKSVNELGGWVERSGGLDDFS